MLQSWDAISSSQQLCSDADLTYLQQKSMIGIHLSFMFWWLFFFPLLLSSELFLFLAIFIIVLATAFFVLLLPIVTIFVFLVIIKRPLLAINCQILSVSNGPSRLHYSNVNNTRTRLLIPHLFCQTHKLSPIKGHNAVKSWSNFSPPSPLLSPLSQCTMSEPNHNLFRCSISSCMSLSQNTSIRVAI